jgi:hypothetical protein
MWLIKCYDGNSYFFVIASKLKAPLTFSFAEAVCNPGIHQDYSLVTLSGNILSTIGYILIA